MGLKTITGPATLYIAGELRAQQARRNWTIDDIAERVGDDLGRSTIARALKGDGAMAVETLVIVATAMGLSPADLIRAAQKVRQRAAAPNLRLVEMSDLDDTVYDEENVMAASEKNYDAEVEGRLND